MDSGEWVPPGRKVKVKFLLFMDVATKLRIVQPLYVYDFLQMKPETAKDFIKTFAERWLGIFPKPKVLLPDSAKSFASEETLDFLSGLNILVHYTAEKESWAHRTVEAAVQDFKTTASAIFLENLTLEPETALHLTASALNSTEYTAGYSAFQWAFGTAYNITDEDIRTYHQLKPRTDFTRLILGGSEAEEVATKNRAQRVLSRLSNTTVRQPLHSYSPMDLVKVWRSRVPGVA